MNCCPVGERSGRQQGRDFSTNHRDHTNDDVAGVGDKDTAPKRALIDYGLCRST